jgi:hypothetical protein
MGGPDSMMSPRVGRGGRGAKEERDNRVRQSSYGLDQTARIKLAAMGGANPLFGGGGTAVLFAFCCSFFLFSCLNAFCSVF